MSFLSIKEAARLVGKDRKTLYRMATGGRLSVTLSATGERQVDIAELVRVFGNFATTGDSGKPVAMPQLETANATDATAELVVLRAENEQLRERLLDKEKNLEDLRGALRLIEYKTQALPDIPAKKWWQKKIF